MGFLNISLLKGIWKNETAWIVGSGPTLDYVDRNFFEHKFSIAINEVARDFKTSFVFAHHRESAQEAIDRGQVVVASEYNRCDYEDGKNDLHGNWNQYHHPTQPRVLVMNMTPFVQDDDTSLVVGSNTVTSAMDFAGRILGASTIILCGVDSGSLDNRWNYRGYNGSHAEIPRAEDGWIDGGTGVGHVRAQVGLIKTVAAALRIRGIQVYSLNPFVDLALEGHRFSR